MKSDTVKQYVSLRDALRKEKSGLEARLREINSALAGEPSLSGTPPAIETPVFHAPAEKPRTLKEAVVYVTSARPMTKQEIIDAIGQFGLRFSGKDPMNSLGTILYGKNPRFRNENGRFSPFRAGGAAKTATRLRAKHAKPSPSGRPELSPEARAKISAAAHARWARVKKSGGRTLKGA